MAGVRRCKVPECPQEAAPRVQFCEEDWLARQPPMRRQMAAQERRDAVPEAARKSRVDKKFWPEGRRWCGNCQTMVRLIDATASMCKACASLASHRSRVKTTYGLDEDAYNYLFKDVQKGRCGICRCRPSERRLSVDHQHGHAACDGKGCPDCVRGLLCVKCNHELLGAARDSLNLLRAAVEYLEHPPQSGEWSIPLYEQQEWAARYGDVEQAPF